MESRIEEVGRIKHFYPKINVAVVELRAPLKVGEDIIIRGTHTSIEQRVESMQIEHQSITTAAAGQSIGLKVNDRVRENDLIFRKTS